MSEKFEYVFDEETKILYKYYFGGITIDDIHSSWDYALANNLIPKETIGFILDYTKANFNIKHSEYPRISEYYRKHLDVFGGHKIAIISQTPRDVVIPTLVQNEDLGYESRPFFTVDAAIDWILGKLSRKS